MSRLRSTPKLNRVRGGAGKRYLQVEADLRHAVDTGKFSAGQRLPDERQLAIMFGVSRGTVRVALQRLAASDRIERHQGRGTFVANSAVKPSYLCLVATGPTVRHTREVATTISQAELVARKRGLHLSVHYTTDADELAHTISQASADRLNAGGLIVGRAAADVVTPLVSNSRIRWVMVGEFAEERRGEAKIHQVLPDWYAVLSAGVQRAIERGSRSIVLGVLGRKWAYSADCISAFRTRCEAAGIPAGDQLIFDLHAYRQQAPSSPEQYRGMVTRAVMGALDRCMSTKRPPDHVILPASALSPWFECLHARAGARRLRNVPITVWALEEERLPLTPSVTPAPITWLLMPVQAQLEQAVYRLLERSASERPPARDYISAFRVEETAPTTFD